MTTITTTITPSLPSQPHIEIKYQTKTLTNKQRQIYKRYDIIVPSLDGNTFLMYIQYISYYVISRHEKKITRNSI